MRKLGPDLKTGVIVGDLATDNDAQRLRESGAPVVQITTGTVCHLEAEMVGRAVKQLDLTGLNLLIIENVGNLVCPASYDLGEDLRIVLLSVTEGEDKPLKYPPMFQSADVVRHQQDRSRPSLRLRPRHGAGQHPARRPQGARIRNLRQDRARHGCLARVSAPAAASQESARSPTLVGGGSPSAQPPGVLKPRIAQIFLP